MITVVQLKELNKKIDQLKDQNSALIAELKVLQGQFDAKAGELSKTLGIPVTAENVEALYMQAQQQLDEKAAKINELLSDLQGNSEGQSRPLGTPSANFAPSFGYTGQPTVSQPVQQSTPVAFGAAPVQGSQPVAPPSYPSFGAAPTQQPQIDGAVAPSFNNFGTGTVFNI